MAMPEYEIPLPMAEELRRKPIINASDLHAQLEEAGFRPLAVVVDNANAKVRAFFSEELDDRAKKRLIEAVLDYHRKHLGIEK
jgi:hypothetical protein